jgi:hypothetical protein
MGFFAHAQVRDTDIVLSISPENPGSNQNVTATLSSYSIDLDKANISWSVNGQSSSMGIGKKTFFFETGSSGTPITLSAMIDTVDGQSVSKTETITPADVDMLWEADDAYSPPFYRGKTLVPSQGIFKVVAMPNLVSQSGKVDASNLSYAWTQDGDPQTDSSGWGKNYLIFQNSYLDKDNVIKVSVSDITGTTGAEGDITLNTTTPKILFYENDPLLGINWETALTDGFKINPNGETIVAAPYFFSPSDISSSDLTFDWSLNGQSINTPTPPNVLSVKPNPGQSGDATINLAVNNINTLFQSLSQQIQVSF